jgi:hypothetical protein
LIRCVCWPNLCGGCDRTGTKDGDLSDLVVIYPPTGSAQGDLKFEVGIGPLYERGRVGLTAVPAIKHLLKHLPCVEHGRNARLRAQQVGGGVAMRKRLVLLWTPLLLGLVLLLPGSSLAANAYTYRTVYNYCDSNYAVHFKARNIVSGASDANKLTIESWAQYKYFGSWHTDFHWKTAVSRFPIDGTTHSLTLSKTYSGGDLHGRIVFRLRAWYNSTLFAEKLLNSVSC